MKWKSCILPAVLLLAAAVTAASPARAFAFTGFCFGMDSNGPFMAMHDGYKVTHFNSFHPFGVTFYDGPRYRYGYGTGSPWGWGNRFAYGRWPGIGNNWPIYGSGWPGAGITPFGSPFGGFTPYSGFLPFGSPFGGMPFSPW